MRMAKEHFWATGLGFLGWVFLGSACLATEDESVDEQIEMQADALDGRIPHPRLRLPNPIDPNRRFLRCLPDPRKNYVARDTEVCAGIRFYCAEGIPFFDECGCGCEVTLKHE
jgi:hypothetical protein